MKYSQVFTTVALSATVAYAADDNPYTMYPSVAKSASINGFADKIYDTVPACAKECLRQSTGNTPCPYWDTGCLCVMPQFGGPIAACIAESCDGQNVVSATKVAENHCSAAGVWEPYWMIPSPSKALLEAAAARTEEEPTPSSTAAPETSKAPETSEAPKTSEAPGTSEAPEPTKAPNSEAPETTAGPSSEAVAPPAESEAPPASGASSAEAPPASGASSAEAPGSSSAMASGSSSDAASSAAASKKSTTSAVPTVTQENVGVNNYPGLIGSFGVVAAGLALFV